MLDFFSNEGKEEYRCNILNARTMATQPKVEKEGFCLATTDQIIDNVNDAITLQAYICHLETILQSHLGAKETFLIGNIIRKEDSKGDQPEINRPTASFIHADWNAIRLNKLGKEYDPFITNNPNATPPRLKKFIEDAAQWSIYNIWVPLQTVTNRPLLLCDIQSVDLADIIHDIRFKNTEDNKKETMGNILSLKYKDNYRWIYYPLMQPNELLIFKQFESNQPMDSFIPVFHTAFKVLDVPQLRFPIRESIEFRFLVK